MDRRRLGRAAPLLLVATFAMSACSWHRPGEADAVAPPPAELPMPSPGLSLAEVIALAEVHEEGDFSADASVLRVAKVSDGVWEDVSIRRARNADLALEAGADYVVVARRTCSDWESRERWSDDRASWFLLAGGKLAAFDHWTFGARCGLGNVFRPVAGETPSRITERDLLRWLEQRHPPGPIPAPLRFQRGQAYVAAGRIPEARSMLRFGDDALETREFHFEARASTEEERTAFEAEGSRLRELRGDLSFAIREAEARAPQAGAP